MRYVSACTILLASLALIGCDTTDVMAPGEEIEAIKIVPESAIVAAGETVDFSVIAVTTAGDTVAAPEVRWWSTDTTIFEVNESGLAVGLDAGEAYCMVETIAAGKAVSFTGRDSAFVMVF